VAAPTFVAEYEASSWSTTSTPKTVTPTTAAGDTLVVLGASENGDTTLATPTGNSHTYTLRQSVAISSDWCAAYGWTTTATTAAGWTLSVTRAGSVQAWGFIALRFSASSGVGASAKTNVSGSAPSLGITTTGANSAVVVIVADWNALDGATRTWRTVNGTAPSAGNGFERAYFRSGATYAVYAAYYPDVGAAGLKTVGLTLPVAQKYSIVAIEVLGTEEEEGVTGDFTAALGAITSAWTGEAEVEGSFTATLPALSGAFTGQRPSTTGDFAATLPAVTAAATAGIEVTGAASVVLSPLTAVDNGLVTVTDDVVIVLGALTAALTGESTEPEVEGELAISLGSLLAEFTGATPGTGELLMSLPALQGEFTGAGFIELTTVDVRPYIYSANATFPVKWPYRRRRV